MAVVQGESSLVLNTTKTNIQPLSAVCCGSFWFYGMCIEDALAWNVLTTALGKKEASCGRTTSLRKCLCPPSAVLQSAVERETLQVAVTSPTS